MKPFVYHPSPQHFHRKSNFKRPRRRDWNRQSALASANLIDAVICSSSGGGGEIVGGEESFLSATSFWISAVQSISSLETLHKIQRFGENIFAGLLSVACLQGVVALGQYRTNPSGQLIVPPGPTIGVAYPNKMRQSNNVPTNPSSNATIFAKAASLFSSANGANSTTADPHNSTTTPAARTTSTRSEGKNRYTRILNTVNKWMILLVPWIARQVSYVLARNTHFFHLVFIVTLSRVFDLPNYWAFQRRLQRAAVAATTPSMQGMSMDAVTTTTETASHRSGAIDVVDTDVVTNSSLPISDVLVLGDSLAVGLGSVDIFDSTKNNTLDYELLQNLDTTTTSDGVDEDNFGPVFPRVLAEALADKQGIHVRWRSAGVDGGDTRHIHVFCLPVLKEEVQQGRTPDLVVLLCGINDLKSYMSKPWPGGNPVPREFRKRLQKLIDSIHQLAPNCTIVLPAIPTQMFHKKSPMNIFPFNFVMDSLIGFWDSLKMGVADRVVDGDDILSPKTLDPKSQMKEGKVYYVRTEPNEVLSWYGKPDPMEPMLVGSSFSVEDETENPRLIAGDGVHPNAKCYALWAQSLADQLLPRDG
jgi:lysophospholipase L1-like esterase